jgi:Predicted transcriptional regulators
MFFFFSPNFSERLKELRSSKGLTMEQLGKEIGSTKGTISNLENGNKKPSLDMLIKLANYFNISIDYLVGRTDEPLLHQKED